MHVARWMGCLTLCVAATAYADTPPEAKLAGCEGLPARGKVARYEAIGEDAFHVAAKSGERYVAFPKEEDEPCAVYPIGKAAVTATGSFGTAVKALALKPKRCASGSCTVAVVTVDKADHPVLALRTRVSGDVAVELKPLKLFASRDSLELVTRNSAGAGWTQHHTLLDASEDTLVTLYSLDAGSYIAASPAEKKTGGCSSCPVGSLRVEQAGDKPLLRVVEPSSGALHDGKGTLQARQLGYDAKKHTFKPTGAPDVATPVDAHAGCK